MQWWSAPPPFDISFCLFTGLISLHGISHVRAIARWPIWSEMNFYFRRSVWQRSLVWATCWTSIQTNFIRTIAKKTCNIVRNYGTEGWGEGTACSKMSELNKNQAGSNHDLGTHYNLPELQCQNLDPKNARIRKNHILNRNPTGVQLDSFLWNNNKAYE
jgi:hypothetical protein